MSWIANNWRLKLLALSLAVVLVFAVGYSQYPIQTVTLDSVTPITLKVEQLTTVDLDIQVRATFANGWQLTKAQAECGGSAQACQVTVSGPVSIMQGLGAYVVVDQQISGIERRVSGSVVRFTRAGSDFDITKVVAFPAISWTPITVVAHVQATQGTETIQVALD